MGTEIQKLLRAARKFRGLRQSDVADLLDLTPAAVSHFETGRTVPDSQKLLRLARHLVGSDHAARCVEFLEDPTDPHVQGLAELLSPRNPQDFLNYLHDTPKSRVRISHPDDGWNTPSREEAPVSRDFGNWSLLAGSRSTTNPPPSLRGSAKLLNEYDGSRSDSRLDVIDFLEQKIRERRGQVARQGRQPLVLDDGTEIRADLVDIANGRIYEVKGSNSYLPQLVAEAIGKSSILHDRKLTYVLCLARAPRDEDEYSMVGRIRSAGGEVIWVERTGVTSSSLILDGDWPGRSHQ